MAVYLVAATMTAHFPYAGTFLVGLAALLVWAPPYFKNGPMPLWFAIAGALLIAASIFAP